MMEMKHRINDDNFVKKFYEWGTPWIQAISFIVFCSFIVGQNYSKFQANAATIENHESRLTILELHNGRIEQKIDDMISFWRVPHRK